MAKIDLRKLHSHLYSPTARDFTVVKVPRLNFLMIDGRGDPNTSPEYDAAFAPLYATAYMLKFYSKLELGKDYAVMPPEGLWWIKGKRTFSMEDKSAWSWTMMILQPDWITPKVFQVALERVRHKKDAPDVSKLRFEAYEEGLSVQIMHIGPYSAEAPTLERMHKVFMPEHDLVPAGKHHEIYMSDPRRTAPEKLKTVLRQPVRPK
jgi:hypothetical protein